MPTYKSGKYGDSLIASFLLMDEMIDAPSGKQEMMQIAKDNPEKKSPLMQMLGINAAGGGGEGPGQANGGTGEPETVMLDSKGCTANVMLIKGDTMYVANAGDSRAVLAVKGVAKELSFDHKPDNEIEKERINKAGSTVVEGRVDGNLNLSRSLGDLKYKRQKHLKPEEQPITCYPDIKEEKITEDCDFVVIACDGIWECRSSQQVVDFVYDRLKKNPSARLSEIVEELLDDIMSPDYTATGNLFC